VSDFEGQVAEALMPTISAVLVERIGEPLLPRHQMAVALAPLVAAMIENAVMADRRACREQRGTHLSTKAWHVAALTPIPGRDDAQPA
jgi:hypothetical protein